MLKGTSRGGPSVLPVLLLTILTCASSKEIPCPKGITTFSAYPNEEAPTPDYYFNCENKIAVLRKCPNGFIYHFKNEKCINDTNTQNRRGKDSDKDSTNDIVPLYNQPPLGRIINLGNIYYATTDAIASHENLWSGENLKKMSLIQQSESSQTETKITKDQLDRNNLIDIEASLALSFMGGLIRVEGSAKYLDDRRKQTNSVQVSLKFDATTVTESITADMKSHLSFTEICNKVGEKNGPTHVVTSLKRGFQGIFSFVRVTEDETKNSEVGGSLYVLIKSVPGIEIEGSASVNITEGEKIIRESIQVNFWGTTILDEAVTTFDDAVKVYKELPEKAKNSRSIVSFGLAPIDEYCDGKAAILNSISKNVVEQSALVLNNLENLQIEIESQLLKPAAIAYSSSLGGNLTPFKTALTTFQNNFKQTLVEILPKIRGGTSSIPLIGLLNEYENSVFEEDRATVFINNRNRELDTVNLFMRNRGEPGTGIVIAEEQSASENQCRIDFAFVIEFVLPVLPEKDLVKKYLEQDTSEVYSERDKWFFSKDKVKKAGNIYSAFTKFYETNKNSPNTCFLVSLKQAKPNKKPNKKKKNKKEDKKKKTQENAQILVTGPSGVISSDYSPPIRMDVPGEIVAGYDEIKFHVSYLDDLMNLIVITYQEVLPTSNITTIKTHQNEIDLTGETEIIIANLSPNKEYSMEINVKAVIDHSFCSVGPKSNIFLVKTTSYSAPSELIEKQTTESSVHLSWSRPLIVAPGTSITKYNVDTFLADCNTDPVKSVKTNVESIEITNLEPAQKYCFKVEPISDIEDKSGKTKCAARELAGKNQVIELSCSKEATTTELYATTKPEAPSNLQVSDIKTNSVFLKWTPPSKIAEGSVLLKYKITYQRINSKTKEPLLPGFETATTEDTSANLTALASGATYTFKVRIETTKGSSKDSEETITTTVLSETELEQFRKSLNLNLIETSVSQHDKDLEKLKKGAHHCAYKGGASGRQSTITFDRMITSHLSHTNLMSGGGVDLGTGVYTAPVPGFYTVNYDLYADNDPGENYVEIFLKHNGVKIEETKHVSMYTGSSGYARAYDQGGRSVVLQLAQGDKLELWCHDCSATVYRILFCISLTTPL